MLSGEDMRKPETTETVYTFVLNYFETTHCAPTLREIAEGCHMGKSTASEYIKILAKEGRLYYSPGKRRALSLPYKNLH